MNEMRFVKKIRNFYLFTMFAGLSTLLMASPPPPVVKIENVKVVNSQTNPVPVQGNATIINTQANPIPVKGVVQVDDSVPVKVDVKPKSGAYVLDGRINGQVPVDSYITGVNFVIESNGRSYCHVFFEYANENEKPTYSSTPIIAELAANFTRTTSEYGNIINFFESKFIPVPNLYAKAGTSFRYNVDNGPGFVNGNMGGCYVVWNVYLIPAEN